MIEFKDVTGAVTKTPGMHFFKMDEISDAAIEEYKSRGAVIVKIDEVSHAHALKLKTARDYLKAQEALGSVRAAAELEDSAVTRLRDIRQADVDKAKAKDDIAAVNLDKAKDAKPKVGRPRKTKGKK